MKKMKENSSFDCFINSIEKDNEGLNIPFYDKESKLLYTLGKNQNIINIL